MTATPSRECPPLLSNKWYGKRSPFTAIFRRAPLRGDGSLRKPPGLMHARSHHEKSPSSHRRLSHCYVQAAAANTLPTLPLSCREQICDIFFYDSEQSWTIPISICRNCERRAKES